MINQWLSQVYSRCNVYPKLGLGVMGTILLVLLATPSLVLPAAADTDEASDEKASAGESGGKKVVDRPAFSCDTDGEVPRTLVKTPSGESLAFINWKTNVFGDNFTPERRCQIVSQRLQNYSSSGKLENLVASTMNGVPVICVGQNKRCDSSLPDNGLVITVRPGVKPEQTLQQISDFRNGSGGELTETTRRMSSLNMYCYLRNNTAASYASCARAQNSSNTNSSNTTASKPSKPEVRYRSTTRNTTPRPSGGVRF
ncbi:MAG: COP23 domain-containing protein [Pseudanabaenaceae cyanobacterium]|jgi:hypothetical protein